MTAPTDLIARDLRSFIRGDVDFDPVSRRLYATDAGLSQMEPLGVVSPRDAEDVALLVAYCAERGLSVVPRGMGSGLNGAAVGAGVQVDFTRYMNSVLDVAPDGSWVRVQPGLVLASLNRHLRPHGSFFAPDPSSENHCSLGGMIGTNASGARTVAYGATKDHVLALDVVLADGTLFKAQPMNPDHDHMSAFLAGSTLAGKAFSVVLPELQANRDAIYARMPRVVKNSCGYRVEAILGGTGISGAAASSRTAAESRDAALRPPASDLAHLQKLFVGAEGTLGIVTEATLNLVPLPATRGIAMAYFPSVFAVGEAVPGILALLPTAVEIMDSRFLTVVRKNDSRVDAMLPEHTDTAILIEFEGRDDAELDDKFAVLRRHLEETAALKLVRATTTAETEHLWKVRKSAVALMQRMPGPRQPLPFVEDITVHPTELPACVDFLQKLFDRERISAVMVGHVGDGNLHTRPVLDPKDPDDCRTMQLLYDEISAYVLSVRGTMSGEHGDGLVHTSRIEEMYGEEIYAFFTRIKNAFDPHGVLNPGKKIGPQDTTGSLFDNVRYGPDYGTTPQKPLLHFAPRGYESEIERCHGCAVCKSEVATTMCPVYKATRREHASPRAKANLLRSVITGALDPESTYGTAAMRTVTDYCIECGVCAVECPSQVNIPKLMLEAKSRYRAARRGGPVEMLLANVETVLRAGGLTAPLANRLVNQPLLRRLVEPVIGIDRRRAIAPFARRTFSRSAGVRAGGAGLGPDAPSPSGGMGLADGAAPADGAATPGRAVSGPPAPLVAYFYDLFAEYNDPALALLVERVLVAHGLRVVIPPQRPSGVPEMLYGYADKAREVARANIAAALPYVKDGALVVSAEPTASFAFKVHYADYVRGTDCSLVANATRDLGELLLRRRLDHPETAPNVGPLRTTRPAAGAVDGDAPRARLRIGYHQPCHLKAQQIGNPAVELLHEIPGLEVVDLAAGCCGMAGTFGMKVGTYDLSMQVGQPLFERVAEIAPDLLLSECSTCRMQLAHATGLEAVHPIVLLAEAYGL
ncbi:MAG: FAD-binding protein [Actinobacteria bacterium]|jgi:FAD/FMN-containing dehydrogenase/Fe-S oxidoreductase|nr:FAD-binding protein [Actinomycetota bacterium]